MNGNPFTANYIGSTGQYPIYDYIKTTSNVLQYNSSNFTKIKFAALSNSVYTEINSIKATDASQNSQISAVEASATASANAIVVQAGKLQLLEDFQIVSTSATAANTTAIAVINNTKLDKTSLDGVSVVYKDLAGNVQLSYDTTTFKDVAVFGANRRLLTLSDTYYNLTTSKQDNIVWNSPLSYDTLTKTASINLNGYLTSNVLSNVNINYGFLHSNAINSLFNPYVSSNVLSNVVSLYVSSNALSNININRGFLHSNVLSNLLYPYVSSNVLSNLNINYGFLHSNAINSLFNPYVSSNVLTNVVSSYLSSNVLSNVNINYGFLHSNVLSNLLSPYALSNAYLPLSGGILKGGLTVGANTSNKDVNIWGNLSILAMPDSNNEFYVKGNITATNLIKTSNLYLGTGDDFFYGNYGTKIISTNNSVIGHDLKFQTRTTANGAFQDSMIINSSGFIGIGTSPSTSKLDVNGIINASDYKIGGNSISNTYVSSNVLTNVVSSYVSSNVLTNVLVPYKPLWKTSGTNVYYNAGNVSIGYAGDGLAPLHVQGAIASINSASWDHVRMFNDGSTAYFDAGGAESGIAFRIDNTSSGYASASYNEKMRILPSGNVGIGKNTPNYTLDVAGTINASKFIVDTGNYIESNCIFQISKNFNVRKNYPYDQFNNLGDTIYMQAGNSTNLCSIGMGVDIVLACQNGNIGLTGKYISLDGIVTFGNSIKAPNIVNKTPFIINASTSVSINGIGGLYKYDLDLRQYTGTFQTSEGYLMRYFKISTFYSSPAKYYNSVYANSYCFSQNVIITNSGGLTFFSPYTLGSWYGEFIGNDNYWMRNSIDYITFIHGHITDVSNSNKKWYVIIEDLLS